SKPVRPDEPGCVLRPDLYYRLAVLEVEVPPLRARRSDVPQLVAHALRGTPARAVSEAAMERLLAYDWPGNVRELLHVVERASVLSGGEIIDVAALPEPLRGLTPRPADASPAPPSRDAPAPSWRDASPPPSRDASPTPSRDAPAPPSRDAPAAPPESAPAPADEAPALTLREAVAELERRMITAALARARGNRSEAARQLGIGRPQLYAKMQEHGVGAKGEGE
ncbi:MAG TPA: helix-turn-helix domain-containing protein, partial [Polyangiaceae bacterium]|nr:helix-turn-helix domain-containing protein [Polyangiaceae bacterium]